jgi:uncharacterized ion transporter superfamily protein YfcC
MLSFAVYLAFLQSQIEPETMPVAIFILAGGGYIMVNYVKTAHQYGQLISTSRKQAFREILLVPVVFWTARIRLIIWHP